MKFSIMDQCINQKKDRNIDQGKKDFPQTVYEQFETIL